MERMELCDSQIICRLCLVGNRFQLLSIMGNEIPPKLKSCTSLDVSTDTHFPMNICVSCYNKLNDLWEFRSMCLESDKILRENYKTMSSKFTKKFVKLKLEEVTIENNELTEKNICNENVCSENSYDCDICQKTFPYICDYLDHQFSHNGEPVFKCDKCNEILSTRQDLINHENNHKISCPICGKVMKRSSLQLHLIGHTDKFKCSQCSQTCASRNALEQHQITVHTNIKSYICENCGKNFASSSSLRTHLLSHSEERKYTCKFCEYAGRTASAIYIHMSKHAKDTCVCSVCSKVFKSTRNLNDHLRRAHCKIKKHVCLYCSRQFVDYYMLKIHLRIHTGLRPYKCDQCNKSFFRSDGLKEHQVLHRERIKYNCDKCCKQYVSKRGVMRHICFKVEQTVSAMS